MAILLEIRVRYGKRQPSKHKSLINCWLNVGPPWPNIDPTMGECIALDGMPRLANTGCILMFYQRRRRRSIIDNITGQSLQFVRST